MKIFRIILTIPFYLIAIIPALLITTPFGLLSRFIYGDEIPGIKFNMEKSDERKKED